MGIINSPPPTTTNATVFRRRLSQTTTFCPTCSSTGIFFTFSYNFVGHIKSVNFKCQAILKPYEKDVLQHIEMPFVEEDHAIKNYVKSIKSIFGSVDDGVISPSAYDTAWVALIEGVNEQSGGPQFPSSLEWIANHQLLDGSWGESMIFSISDRLVNTLACVIALTTWKVHPDKCKKGLNFVEDNIYKLGDQNEEHKTHGLELVFPALIELAGKLDLKVPNDSPVIKEMYKRRERKLLKIPKEKVHNTPTIMIYSLEGMKDLEWDKLLKLQSENGSIVYSPSATAFSFMQTKDQKCLTYLTNLVHKFKGGVPHVYPVEIFEQIWMVDRLQRLGIARYFQSEIKECTDYIYRMENISNNQYLEMAKLDYNQCQTIHQLEWTNIQKWYAHLNIKETINTRLLNSYYEAATSIFEPERCNKRVAWAKTNVIVNTITSFFARPHLSNTGIQAFAYEFTNTQHHEKNRKPWDGMMNALHETLNEISLNTRVAYGVDIYPHLHSIWKVWLLNLQNGVDKVEGEAELIVKTINLCSSQCLLDESFSHPQYQRLSSIINDICHQISHKGNRTISFEIESKMQELVQLVLCDSPDDLDTTSKQTFLMVAKTFYYRALFDPETINQHIGKVLFENVI
ncbi:(-)-kolavenyl diphosphate synthase TPS28, chloroplastic isoform X3 [Helianthus annuus]|uniref:(-)-kolavenyl diphosphate synthase TPS28, chloroplastic isoform X3 n=1 Tax=Helianthus annuus TaxID=4232 RepID=UPI001652CF6C|nr:(-)-kolavenyl diphosphate synthase TPS28, chloroplastic isoform X3 [Helianthus annuus]